MWSFLPIKLVIHGKGVASMVSSDMQAKDREGSCSQGCHIIEEAMAQTASVRLLTGQHISTLPDPGLNITLNRWCCVQVKDVEAAAARAAFESSHIIEEAMAQAASIWRHSHVVISAGAAGHICKGCGIDGVI